MLNLGYKNRSVNAV